MKAILTIIIIFLALHVPVHATEFTAPTVPYEAEKYFPEDTQSFSEGLWSIIKTAISELRPDIADAARVCFTVFIIIMLVSVLKSILNTHCKSIHLAATVMIGITLITPSGNLIQFAVQTISLMSEYGKLLLPVMTAALAAQGASTTAAALCTGSLFFISLLTLCISNLLTPFVYIYMALGIAKSALSESVLDGTHKFVKWLMTWLLKIILYVFTGYLSITGVVSGGIDASALKAAKLTISGVVPVVGSIISDASEAILAGAGVMKNAAGVYGLLAIVSLCVSPFLRIGVHYLLLKATAGICSIFSDAPPAKLLKDMTSVMGFLLAMTAAVCVMLLISTVCFMKGAT